MTKKKEANPNTKNHRFVKGGFFLYCFLFLIFAQLREPALVIVSFGWFVGISLIAGDHFPKYKTVHKEAPGGQEVSREIDSDNPGIPISLHSVLWMSMASICTYLLAYALKYTLPVIMQGMYILYARGNLYIVGSTVPALIMAALMPFVLAGIKATDEKEEKKKEKKD